MCWKINIRFVADDLYCQVEDIVVSTQHTVYSHLPDKYLIEL